MQSARGYRPRSVPFGPWLVLLLAIAPALAVRAEENVTPPPTTPRQSGQSAARYDPHAGVNPNGRIPRVDLPSDIAHPERWRYIPEGRLKPGNMFDRFLVSSFVGPIFFFDEEVGFGGGVAVTDIDFRDQRRREWAGMFFSMTTEGQQRYSVEWQRWLHHRELDGGGVVREGRSFLLGEVGYRRTLTRRFFGLGPETRKSDESDFVDELTLGSFGFEMSVPDPGSSWVIGASLAGQHTNISRGRVDDVDDTIDSFPELFEDGDSRDLMWVSGSLRYDTRDSVAQPYRGWVIGADADAAVVQDKGNAGVLTTVFASVVFPLPPLFHAGGDADEENPPTDTLGLGARLQWVNGDLPFWALPSLGGTDTLRGFVPHRWTGRAVWHAAAEYRFWFVPRGFKVTDSIRIERVGAALFVEAGTVEHRLDRLETAHVKWSGGVGMRFALERTTVFRIDLGISDDGANLALDTGLTF
jgi:hypothetical protein